MKPSPIIVGVGTVGARMLGAFADRCASYEPDLLAVTASYLAEAVPPSIRTLELTDVDRATLQRVAGTGGRWIRPGAPIDEPAVVAFLAHARETTRWSSFYDVLGGRTEAVHVVCRLADPDACLLKPVVEEVRDRVGSPVHLHLLLPRPRSIAVGPVEEHESEVVAKRVHELDALVKSKGVIAWFVGGEGRDEVEVFGHTFALVAALVETDAAADLDAWCVRTRDSASPRGTYDVRMGATPEDWRSGYGGVAPRLRRSVPAHRDDGVEKVTAIFAQDPAALSVDATAGAIGLPWSHDAWTEARLWLGLAEADLEAWS